MDHKIKSKPIKAYMPLAKGTCASTIGWTVEFKVKNSQQMLRMCEYLSCAVFGINREDLTIDEHCVMPWEGSFNVSFDSSTSEYTLSLTPNSPWVQNLERICHDLHEIAEYKIEDEVIETIKSECELRCSNADTCSRIFKHYENCKDFNRSKK